MVYRRDLSDFRHIIHICGYTSCQETPYFGSGNTLYENLLIISGGRALETLPVFNRRLHLNYFFSLFSQNNWLGYRVILFWEAGIIPEKLLICKHFFKK